MLYRCLEIINFGSDPLQNGCLINDLRNVTIFLNAENAKTHLSQKRSEMGAILTKILTHRVSVESIGNFSQKSFSRHF